MPSARTTRPHRDTGPGAPDRARTRGGRNEEAVPAGAAPPAVVLALLVGALAGAETAAAQTPAADSGRAGGASAAVGSPSPVPLVTDRPDFTESSASVAPGRFQVESGYTLARRNEVDSHAIGEVLVRVGLLSFLEARLAPGSYAVIEAPGRSADGFLNPSVGAKATLLEPARAQSSLVPSVALLGSTTLPAGEDAVSADGAEPEAALALAWTLGDRLSLGANLGHGRLLDGGDRFGQTVASAAVGVDASGPLGAYAEFYTLRPNAPGANAADVANGGLTLLLGRDGQLDVRLGAGLSGEAPDLILGAGVAWRR